MGRLGRLRLGFDESEPAMSKLKDVEWLFSGRHFDREIIVLCVRWYLRYKLSLRDLVEMMGERGASLSHAPKEVPVGHNDHALGQTLYAGTRETLESVRDICWTLMASRRDVWYAQPT